MMQAFLVLPAFALVYLRGRADRACAAGSGSCSPAALALVVSAGWWVAIVALWPAGSRPFIDGSPDNSILNLIVGYNGLGRIFGSGGPGGGGGGGANFSGATGPLRLFNDLMGGQASWLLPAALLALVAGLWARRRAPRTDRTRAALLLWGGWLLVTAVVFSFVERRHPHLLHGRARARDRRARRDRRRRMLWRQRERSRRACLAAVAVAAAPRRGRYVLLDRTPTWHRGCGRSIVVGAALARGRACSPARRSAAAARAAPASSRPRARRRGACLAGPLAYAAQTITTAHTGPSRRRGPGGAGASAVPAAASPAAGGLRGVRGGEPPAGAGRGGFPAAAPPSGGFRGGHRRPPRTAAGASRRFRPRARGPARRAASRPGGGGAPRRARPSPGARSRTPAATAGSPRRPARRARASLELATGGEPVMAIGGFNGQGGDLEPGAVRALRRQGRDPLLHRRRRWRRPGRRRLVGEHHVLGAGALQGADDRRRDGYDLSSR